MKVNAGFLYTVDPLSVFSQFHFLFFVVWRGVKLLQLIQISLCRGSCPGERQASTVDTDNTLSEVVHSRNTGAYHQSMLVITLAGRPVTDFSGMVPMLSLIHI